MDERKFEECVLRARRSDIGFGSDYIKLYIYQKRGEDRFVVDKLELVKSPKGTPLESFLEIDNHIAQQLIDDLWDCGLRPSEGKGSTGAMRKIENHLQDMRIIVSRKLGIKLDK